jgi:S-DNA-T family DNA segregation ATPase FtsK/SpoIIIE
MIIPPVKDNHDVWRAIQQAEIQIHSRYGMHYKVKAKNIAEFNSRPPDLQPVFDDGNVIPPKLPFLVVIVDELSHAMKGNNKEDAEYDICRIAQKGRAAGVHLVIATNSLRRFVVTGLIKANIPTKIAFRVGNVNASRLVLDCKGAEKLLGNGDMLFNPPCGASLERIQGAHVSEDEMRRVVDVVSRNAGTSG